MVRPKDVRRDRLLNLLLILLLIGSVAGWDSPIPGRGQWGKLGIYCIAGFWCVFLWRAHLRSRAKVRSKL